MYGDKEAREMIEKIKEKVQESEAKAIAMGALYIVNTAKQLAPKDTGNLAQKISHEITENEDGRVTAIVGPTEDVKYAKYVEYGTGIYAVHGDGRKTPWVWFSERWNRFIYTHGNKPQPFLYPALQRNMKKLKNLLELSFKEGWGKLKR